MANNDSGSGSGGGERRQGSGPDTLTPAPGGTALLIVDMINDMSFDGADALRDAATEAAGRILALRETADALGLPVIYVNDNDDQWHSERSRIVARAAERAGGSRPMVERLAPRDDDYFVIKPQFSGFYATNLPVLLPKLGVSRLVLTGVAADICVLFTAADAHMRDYGLWVPRDAVASNSPERTGWALEIMDGSMGADVRPTTERSLEDWVAAG